MVEAREIFLLSDSSELHSCQYSGNLSGIPGGGRRKSRKRKPYDSLFCPGNGVEYQSRSEEDGGKPRVHGAARYTLDTGVFETVRQLSEEAQERYCVFKSVELLYLLCTEAEEADGAPSGTGCPVSHNLLEIKAYIQAHLSEKLTIDLLCKQFSVSPTFLKEGFRRAYGVPIHTYLIRQRLRRAQELICTTRMPIQQIAQSVGYEGMSQFNTAFKREYGMTPASTEKCRKPQLCVCFDSDSHLCFLL